MARVMVEDAPADALPGYFCAVGVGGCDAMEGDVVRWGLMECSVMGYDAM